MNKDVTVTGFVPVSETEMMRVEGGFCTCPCPFCRGLRGEDEESSLPNNFPEGYEVPKPKESLNEKLGIPSFKNPPKKKIIGPLINGGIGISISID